jgi:hypothetical protein
MQQKSFIGGVPTDNIIEVLDEEEDIIESKLDEINEAKDPEKDILNVETDEETEIAPSGNYDDEDQDIGVDEEDDDDDFFDDGMDNGIQN